MSPFLASAFLESSGFLVSCCGGVSAAAYFASSWMALWPAASGAWLSVVVTNLKTSKESGFSAEAAEMPKKFPKGSLILVDSKQSFPSTVTLKDLSD